MSSHGNEEEIVRQNSNAFSLQKMGLDTSVLKNIITYIKMLELMFFSLLCMAKIIKRIKVTCTI